MDSKIMGMLKEKLYKLEEELYYNYGKIPYEEYLSKNKEISDLKHEIAVQGIREYSPDMFMADMRRGIEE
jgi:hypothetical protein